MKQKIVDGACSVIDELGTSPACTDAILRLLRIELDTAGPFLKNIDSSPEDLSFFFLASVSSKLLSLDEFQEYREELWKVFTHCIDHACSSGYLSSEQKENWMQIVKSRLK